MLALAHAPEVKRVFEKQSPSQQEIDGALEQVRRSGVLDEATRMAHAYGKQTLKALEVLPPSPYYDGLAFFVSQLVNRTA